VDSSPYDLVHSSSSAIDVLVVDGLTRAIAIFMSVKFIARILSSFVISAPDKFRIGTIAASFANCVRSLPLVVRHFADFFYLCTCQIVRLCLQ